MENEELLDKVQNLLLDFEERVNGRFEKIEERFDKFEERVNRRFDRLEADIRMVDMKVESVRAEVKLLNELLAPFITWSHRIEDEIIRLSAALQDVQSRLAKLEKPVA